MKKIIIFLIALISCFVFFGCTSQQDFGKQSQSWKDFDYDKTMNDISNGTPGNPDIPTLPIEPIQPIKTDIMLKATSDNVTIRSGAGSKFPSVGVVNKGDLVSFGKMEKGWYKTVYKEKTAYISSKYVQEISFEKGDAVVENIIEVGKTLLGHPYIFGAQRYHWGNGVKNSSFVAGQYDCSSMMQYMFFIGGGINLDVDTRTQVLQGTTVSRSNLQRGDVIFFTNASRYYNTGIERIGHVGMYIGNNYIMHTAFDYAVVEPLSDQRWAYYIVAKRF